MILAGWITDRKVGQIIIGSILSAAAQSPNCRELTFLEPVCCKKKQKKVPDQLLVSGIGDLSQFRTV